MTSALLAGAIPLCPRRRREKCFGDGRPQPMDREAKVRLTACAKALKQRTLPGKHYGAITAKDFDVLEQLIWRFHNERTGLCFPSYETLAEAAKCNRSTVAVGIKRMEAAGLLSWVHRLKRVRRRGAVKVMRSSNGYQLVDPLARTKSIPLLRVARRSESEFPTGTLNQRFLSSTAVAELYQRLQRGEVTEAFVVQEHARLSGI